MNPTLPASQVRQAPGPAASPPVAAGQPEFHVQAGAFKNREYANDLIQQLRAKGFTATLAEGPLLRVMVGPRTSRAGAERLVANLRANGFDALLSPVQ